MKLIFGVGINDMPRGWISENELNKRIYHCWHDMLRRCYNEKERKNFRTYKECYVCDKWHKLSGFVEDVRLIDNYDFWARYPNKRIALDKDIKVKGNKCYCLEKCIFATMKENNGQRDLTQMSAPVIQIDKKTKEQIRIFYRGAREVERILKINPSHIYACCLFYYLNCNKEKWYEIRNDNPYKSVGGYIWNYYNK